jgi:hypothetical protein
MQRMEGLMLRGAEQAISQMIDAVEELVAEDPSERHLTLLSDMTLIAAGYVLEYAEPSTELVR